MAKRMSIDAQPWRVASGGAMAALLAACGGGGEAALREERLSQRASAILAEFDSDRDRVVTREELDNRRTTSFRIADLNGDGFVTADEATETNARLTDITPQGRLLERLGPRPLDPATQDANRDGALSLREYLALPLPLLVRFDLDRDGQVTRDELETPSDEDRPDV